MAPPCIVHIDDNPVDARAVRRAVRKAKLDVALHQARDGEAGLALIRERVAEGDTPVVLVDLKMPKLDGMDVIWALRSAETTRALPVFVLSTSDDAADIAAAWRAHVAGYLCKNSLPDGMAAVGPFLREWLAANRLPPSPAA